VHWNCIGWLILSPASNFKNQPSWGVERPLIINLTVSAAQLLPYCCVPCRQGYIEAATLSALLKQHTTADLFNSLQALVDYLMLPGPVTKYLPLMNKVPLPYVTTRLQQTTQSRPCCRLQYSAILRSALAGTLAAGRQPSVTWV
jgi:hypothetical protein